MLNFILTNKKIARQGYITLLNHHEVRHLAWVHHKKGLPLRQVLFACLFGKPVTLILVANGSIRKRASSTASTNRRPSITASSTASTKI